MENKLTPADWSIILDSLKYSRKTFEEYQGYPSYEFKQKKVQEVNDLINKRNEVINS